jgi:hypothetical protein
MSLAAQEPIRPNLEGLKYPVIPRSARIQGTVQYVVKSDGIELVSGHRMLAAAAKSNLEKWATPYTNRTPLSVTYIFRLQDVRTEIVERDEPVGDMFDRFFLRLFRRPVTRRIKQEVCLPPIEMPAVYKNETQDNLPRIEIEIESGVCRLQPDVVAIAALRH